MNQNDLQPASSIAKRLGVKCLAYGGPGTAKTPSVLTLNNPLMLVTEPGVLTLKNASHIPAFEAFTYEKIEEFFEWFFNSSEPKQFNTLFVDSISQMCEIYLAHAKTKMSHGLQQYGWMASEVYQHAEKLYYSEGLNVFLIAKQTTLSEGGIERAKPYFPGKELNTKIPHLYDEILHFGRADIVIEGQTKNVPVIQTQASSDIYARDRSGNLNMYEPIDLQKLFNKVLEK